MPPATKETPAVGRAPEARLASAPKPESPAGRPRDAEPSAPAPPSPAGPGQGSAGQEPGAAGDRLAALRPQAPGGGLRDGRGGIEGEPIPLDTKDPKFNDYFERVRRAIKDKWSYPREAAEKNIGGQLRLEFGIAKNGHLRYIELHHSSGVAVLDSYAMTAVKLASPFPEIPDAISRTGIPVMAVFNYIIDIGSLNQFLR